MKSIKDEQFNIPIAEDQDEYHTLYANIDFKDPSIPVRVKFKLTPEDLAEVNANGGHLFYTQCVSVTLNEETGQYETGDVHPMNISPFNPLENDLPEGH